MKLHLHSSVLQLRHSFAISRGSYQNLNNLVVGLQQDQHTGWGEATQNAYYPHSNIELLKSTLERLQDRIQALPIDHPEKAWTALAPELSATPFAQCALDVACWDLFAKSKNIPLYQYWQRPLDHLPISSYTLSIADIPTLIERLKANPWPIYKIKLGTDQDLEIVEALRAHTDAIFRVDANCGWTLEETLEKAPKLKALGVEFIEQPLPTDQWEAMEELYARSPLPLFADESCQTLEDITRCKGRFHGITIKLMKCGGITPALRMITKAEQLGLKKMMGCMVSSSIGISAIAQLLPMLDYVDMDGALLLAHDIAEGARVTAEGVQWGKRNGTGAHLLEV